MPEYECSDIGDISNLQCPAPTGSPVVDCTDFNFNPDDYDPELGCFCSYIRDIDRERPFRAVIWSAAGQAGTLPNNDGVFYVNTGFGGYSITQQVYDDIAGEYLLNLVYQNEDTMTFIWKSDPITVDPGDTTHYVIGNCINNIITPGPQACSFTYDQTFSPYTTAELLDIEGLQLQIGFEVKKIANFVDTFCEGTGSTIFRKFRNRYMVRKYWKVYPDGYILFESCNENETFCNSFSGFSSGPPGISLDSIYGTLLIGGTSFNTANIYYVQDAP